MLFLWFKKLSIYTYQLASYVDNVLLMGLFTDPPPPYYLPHVRAPPHSAMYQSVSREPAWRVSVWGLIVQWSIEGHTDHDECTADSGEQRMLLGPSYNRIIWQRTIKLYSVWHALRWCKFSVLRRMYAWAHRHIETWWSGWKGGGRRRQTSYNKKCAARKPAATLHRVYQTNTESCLLVFRDVTLPNAGKIHYMTSHMWKQNNLQSRYCGGLKSYKLSFIIHSVVCLTTGP